MANTTKKDPVLIKRGIIEGNNLNPTGKLNYQPVELDDGLLLSVEVPGVDPSTIEMEETGDTIVISCERGELVYPIEASLDQSQLEAAVKWGMLEIYIPRRQGRSVKIQIAAK